MSNLDDYLFATGDETRNAIESKPRVADKHPRFTYLKLQDGESARGFLLTTNFVLYMKHSDYNNRHIKPHTCKNPKDSPDKVCISCQYGVKRHKRTIVPFYNVDTQAIQVFDATPTAMKGVYQFLDEYEEEALTTPISISRSGSEKDTTYSIIPTRVKPAEKLLFSVPTDVTIDEEFILGVLNVRDDDFILKLIGLPEGSDETNAGSTDQVDDATLGF